jgi:hypothetical protein
VATLQLGKLRVGVGDLLFKLDRRAVAQLSSLREVSRALGPVGFAADFFEPRFERANPPDDLLLLVPARPQRCALGRELRQLPLERAKSFLRRLVRLLLERLALDLELADLSFELVELGRQRVDLRAQPSAATIAESLIRTPWCTS